VTPFTKADIVHLAAGEFPWRLPLRAAVEHENRCQPEEHKIRVWHKLLISSVNIIGTHEGWKCKVILSTGYSVSCYLSEDLVPFQVYSGREVQN